MVEGPGEWRWWRQFLRASFEEEAPSWCRLGGQLLSSVMDGCLGLILLVFLSVHHRHAWCKKRVSSDPLKLEFQSVVSHHVGSGI